MAQYKPVKILGMSTGLVQDREEFILPDDAYPTLQNAYVWRERIKRKKGFQILGRLRLKLGTTDGSGNFSTTLSVIPINVGISQFLISTDLFTDPESPSGSTTNPVNLITNGSGSGTLDRTTGLLNIAGSISNQDVWYYPGLPVMGIRTRDVNTSLVNQTIFFDQAYAYVFDNTVSQFKEFIPGTTWNAAGQGVSEVDFFWSTNYWSSDGINFVTTGRSLFWVTNNSGHSGASADPPRITDGSTWLDFFPSTWSQINATTYLTNWLAMLPYRGRMVVFNTWEGPTAAGSINYSNRIRWSTIGNPFIAFSNGPPATGSWRDDIRGQGGYLDIPTTEDIVSIGFVRDNLVIYCESSTWQLRYTGRSIAPFQVEKVNTELGAAGTFSAIQFDTSLVGIGDKGIVECDSYKSERIDIKITDFVWKLQNKNNNPQRIQAIRDFQNRLAYWTICYASWYDPQITVANQIFPNQRLVYNYENDSWAQFNDSLTALGTYQPNSSRTWINTPIPWTQCNFPWISQPALVVTNVGGNQHGFVEFLDEQTTNDPSLFISNILPNSPNPTIVICPNHNLQTNFVIKITSVASGTDFVNLNNGIFSVDVIDANSFYLYKYNSTTQEFSDGQVDSLTKTYKGGGVISILDNFFILSKKFNFMDEGQNIQVGYLDILMNATESTNPGAITLNIYQDYNEQQTTNTLPQNAINDGLIPQTADTFFNTIIPTSSSDFNTVGGTKFWQRIFCPVRGNFITLEYTLSNAQMAGSEQNQDVQIDAQILWLRHGGRMTKF